MPTAELTRFRHDLRRGLGSALLTLQASASPEQYTDAVRWACLNVTTYDFQSEGSRGWYLHQAATLTGQAPAIESDVRKQFATSSPDGHRFEQLGGILLHYALDGSNTARQALWDRYADLMARLTRTIRRDGWWQAMTTLEGLALDLVAIDGWPAAKTAVLGFGNALALARPDAEHERWQYFPDWFDSEVKEQFGETDAHQNLVGDSSEAARVYAATAATYRTRPWAAGKKTPVPAPAVTSLKDVVEQARHGDGTTWSIRSTARKLVRDQNTAHAEAVAHLGMAETDPALKAEILWPFRKWPFPLPDDTLTDLVDTDHEALRQIVRSILGQRVAEWKRSHALHLLDQDEQPDEALDLLMASYQPEDEATVDAAIRRIPLRGNEWHSAFLRLTDLLKPEDRPVTTSVLAYIYRETLCSNCRVRTVKLMHDKHVLPAEIIEQCRWDSNDHIRDLAEQWTAG